MIKWIFLFSIVPAVSLSHAQVGVGVVGGNGSDRNTAKDRMQNIEYQHQYYVYNDAGKKVKLYVKAATDIDDMPFEEKEITVSFNDTVYLGNFMSSRENVRPQEVFQIFVMKRKWLFFNRKYEAFINVTRRKVGTDAVNYYLKIMGTKRKENKKKRFED